MQKNETCELKYQHDMLFLTLAVFGQLFDEILDKRKRAEKNAILIEGDKHRGTVISNNSRKSKLFRQILENVVVADVFFNSFEVKSAV